MIHPLLKLVATQPQLLADHAEAYAELVGEEFGTVNAVSRVVYTLVGVSGLYLVTHLARVIRSEDQMTPATR